MPITRSLRSNRRQNDKEEVVEEVPHAKDIKPVIVKKELEEESMANSSGLRRLTRRNYKELSQKEIRLGRSNKSKVIKLGQPTNVKKRKLNEDNLDTDLEKHPAKRLTLQKIDVDENVNDIVRESSVEVTKFYGGKHAKENITEKLDDQEDTNDSEPEESASHSDTSSDSDSEDDNPIEDGLSQYERQRIKNMRENAAFLLSSGLSEVKDSFITSVTGGKPSKPKPRQYKQTTRQILPLRQRSYRLQGKDPEGTDITHLQPVQYAEPIEEHPRKPTGKLNMAEYNIHESIVGEGQFLNKLATISESKISKTLDKETSRLVSTLKRMKLKEGNAVKTVKDRIFSVAIHPSEENILIAAGDKWGKIGFLNLDETDEDKRVYGYEVHSRPVNCLQFTADRLYSCSYDGTLRSCDLRTGVFDEHFRTPDDDQDRCMSFDFYDPRTTLIVALSDGRIVGVDGRTDNTKGEEFSHRVHDRLVKSVSVHPIETHYVTTCTNNGVVSLWDLRHMKAQPKSVVDLPHFKGVNSVTFSPITGNQLVTVSMDDKIRLYDTSDLSRLSKLPQITIKHDCHVGRWLTGFRASWHPASDDVFVMGSMNRPREIVLYSSKTGESLHRYQDINLASVNSVNVFHRTRNILVGGNSSGRLHVFT